ncbi:MAG: pyruvate kinase [Clostridiales bacterium]|uniref:Pyruvate kinase n=1 Tax=Harryflintia acetispora TaxID=1849041 RepID=A0A9X8UKZ5_9FIRM|nr:MULTISPECIES: pyruvate kinase [Oscillospiraceae]PWM39784.1 MAG: pyruvate kinase [Clostridiales bacterium]RGB69945.1 pyruvate kinase [Harryflintia acetispora]TCL44732.1 pyruvate kinase [Harryflintia acetispora]
MRKTKIVCTLGPATDSPEIMRELILAGMNIARFNFSHGTHEEHKKRLQLLRDTSAQLGIPVATLMDTKGPEIRLGNFKNHRATLERGNLFILTSDEVEGDENRVSITFKELAGDLKPGDKVLLDDGLIELRVQAIEGTNIICRVQNGGDVSDKKGVNVPDIALSMPYISERDREDLIFAVGQDFDFIAASFVRTAQDIAEIRKILDEQGCDNIHIIAKIENAQGVANIDEILRLSSGVMVARGDMGVEIPFEDVPVIQKKLIKRAYNAGKFVITATQMLDSMMKNPRPTRAEATDVANAIYDGTSAIMLSGETAAGKYPVESVKTMATIARRAEDDIDYEKRFYGQEYPAREDITNAISHATCTTAYDLGAAAIITVTSSGRTARMISRYRPLMPIIGCTYDEKVYRQMNMSWGVIPLMCQVKENTDELFEHAVQQAQKAGLVRSGDIVVITAGVPLGVSGTTNLLKVHAVGNVLVTGQGVNKLSCTGNACVAHSEEEARQNFNEGDILVIRETSNGILDLLKKASGIVCETQGLNSHAAIVGMTLDIPVIVGAKNASSLIKNSTVVTVDADKGIVCNAGR